MEVGLIISYFLYALALAIFLRAILSWFPVDPRSPLVQILDQLTEPILSPLRRVVPRMGMIDITPMIATFILIFLAQAVAQSL